MNGTNLVTIKIWCRQSRSDENDLRWWNPWFHWLAQ
jgi:hypothetical protein